MDLVKTLLAYMVLVMGSAVGGDPAVTPKPFEKSATPTPYVTVVPTQTPTLSPTDLPQTSAPTVLPSETPVSYKTLSKGDRGEDVTRLQTRLAEMGYDPGTIDGAYGNKTKKAVESFQSDHGLKVDGIAGRMTQSLLFELETESPAPQATETPQLTPPPEVAEVKVFYQDEEGNSLFETAVSLYTSGTVYAQNDKVPSGYILTSENKISVTVEEGRAEPSEIIFVYHAPEPTAAPTQVSTQTPTARPTEVPTEAPTESPTQIPTETPTNVPTVEPTTAPTEVPTQTPTEAQTERPTLLPTEKPTDKPTESPTVKPTQAPTETPVPTVSPETVRAVEKGGDTIWLSDEETAVSWYLEKNETDTRVLLDLVQLLRASGVEFEYDPSLAALSVTINGFAVYAEYDEERILLFTLDGSALEDMDADPALEPVVYENALLVSGALLDMLNVSFEYDGETVRLSNF